MAELQINIRMSNAAFEDDPDGEVMVILSRIVQGLAENAPIKAGTLKHANSLFDTNGARVGQIKVHEEE